jgi:cytochrome c peroxidase
VRLLLRLHAALGIALATATSSSARAGTASLAVEFIAHHDGQPLALESIRHRNPAGQALAFSRLDLLLSDFALQRDDGTWIGLGDWSAFLSQAAGRTRFLLREIPPGRYQAARFQIGLHPHLNQADPSSFPADHPLNPNLNGLHWNWKSGFVFLALEGSWRSPSGHQRGFSYHLGGDTMRLPLETSFVLDAGPASHHLANLSLDLALVLKGIEFGPDTLSTHSREGDPLAALLHHNLTSAFGFTVVEKAPPAPSPTHPPPSPPLVAPGARLLPFEVPPGFPIPTLPHDNPLTAEGVELGTRLFAETRLSHNASQSCSSCHPPERGFTDHTPTSIGALGQPGRRRAMPLVNLAWKTRFFWDGRAPSLREAALMPIEDPSEMAASLPAVVAALASDPFYPPAFARAFGDPSITPDRIGRALEQFLITRISASSKFDQVTAGLATFTASEQRGFDLFHSESDPRRGILGADCFHCHGGPLFTNHQFSDNGLALHPQDPGLAGFTARQSDTGKFAVPSLRNLAGRSHFMHDGRLPSLADAVAHYTSGVQPNPNLDPNLAKHPAGRIPLSEPDREALVDFLLTLSPAHAPEGGDGDP